MENQVDEIFRNVMEWGEADKVSDDMSPDTVEEWDSLISMELILKIERAFSVKFDYEEIVDMESIGDIKRVLRQKL